MEQTVRELNQLFTNPAPVIALSYDLLELVFEDHDDDQKEDLVRTCFSSSSETILLLLQLQVVTFLDVLKAAAAEDRVDVVDTLLETVDFTNAMVRGSVLRSVCNGDSVNVAQMLVEREKCALSALTRTARQCGAVNILRSVSRSGR